MRLRYWALSASILVLLAALSVALLQRGSDRDYAVHSTIDRSKCVIHGCNAYRKDPRSGGKYPTSLDELITPHFGGKPFLDDHEYCIADGWGKRLKFATVNDGKGETEVYAWGERSVNGKMYVYGAKGTVDGTIVLFGLPE